MKLETGNITVDLQRWKTAYLLEVANRNLSSNTLGVYGSILDHFIEYSREFQGEAGIEDINRLFINGYLDYRVKNSSRFSASSKKLNITVLKTFFAFITENNDENVDFEKIFKKIVIKTEQKLKPSLNDDDVIKLLRFLDKERDGNYIPLIKARNALMCKTLLYSGMREHELMQLKLGSFDSTVTAKYRDKTTNEEREMEMYLIVLTGKGGKEISCYIPADMISDELDTLVTEYGKDRLLCSTQTGTLLNRVNIYQTITGIYRRAGIDKKGVHILRHTFARRHVDNGTNLETIKELLGHSSIAITSRFYAKTNEKNKRVAVAEMVGVIE